MLNKDNLENGLQHSAASVPPPSPVSLHTHTQLPQGRSAHVCFDLAPRFGAGGFRRGRGGYVGGLKRCMAMDKTDQSKDRLSG